MRAPFIETGRGLHIDLGGTEHTVWINFETTIVQVVRDEPTQSDPAASTLVGEARLSERRLVSRTGTLSAADFDRVEAAITASLDMDRKTKN